jgi:hypothetical protein
MCKLGFQVFVCRVKCVFGNSGKMRSGNARSGKRRRTECSDLLPVFYWRSFTSVLPLTFDRQYLGSSIYNRYQFYFILLSNYVLILLLRPKIEQWFVHFKYEFVVILFVTTKIDSIFNSNSKY